MSSRLQQTQNKIMSYDASKMNNMQQTYAADETTAYTHLLPPTSSQPPSPTPAYNNHISTINGGGADAGESNHALVVTTVGMNVSGGDVVKPMRGRPRINPIGGSKLTVAVAAASDLASPAPNSGKRPRGRPPGSTNKVQPAASGAAGVGFMPYVLDVNSGEDVLAKLARFSQNSKKALCILSASGTISNVTLEQAATCGGIATYEGRFEILSLSGSFKVPESDNQGSRICGLSVALSGPGGRVLGGKVAGLLTAASPVQVIVGSFVPASRKQSEERGSSEEEVVNGLANPLAGIPEIPVGQSNNSYPQDIVDMLWG